MVEKMKDASQIKPIDKASIHRICSGQVILDLATAVKELVENSLDAGATSIEVKLKEYGAESFEVADNGCGVSPENYQALTLKYHTSKISDFADLQSLSSFGFRGEALSSLCALADLTIVTRTKNEPVATQLQFDHSGSIISQKTEARSVGTTVTVTNLFKSLPVRHKEFNRNIRREYSRLLTILNAYALMAKNVRLVCSHITGKSRSVILKTQGTNSIKDNIITVFGTKLAGCLEPVSLSIGNDCHIEGFVSKPGSGSGRASGDRQFFYINNRPVELPKVGKMLNELYRSFNSLQYPMAVLNFILPTMTYDVNVTPDKRKVFLHSESDLMSRLRESLESVYSPDKYTFTVRNLESEVFSQQISTPTKDLPEFETQKCITEKISIETTAVDVQSDPSEDEDVQLLKMQEVDTLDTNCDSRVANDKISYSVTQFSLDSFKRNSLTPSEKLRGVSSVKETDNGAVKGQYISPFQPKVTQSKLTGFVTNLKRLPEDNSLLSEEPVLKKWLLSPNNSPKVVHNTSLKGPSNLCPDSPGVVQNPLLKGAVNQYPDSPRTVHNTSLKIQNDLHPQNFKSTFNSHACDDSYNVSCCSKQKNTVVHKEEFLGHVVNEKYDRTSPSTPLPPQACPSPVNQERNTGMTTEAHENSSPPSTALPPRACQSPVEQEGNTDMTTEAQENSPASKNGLLTINDTSSSVAFDLKKLRLKYKQHIAVKRSHSNVENLTRKDKCFRAASMGTNSPSNYESGKEEALDSATRELDRIFDKADFKNMKVLGQFNLGFILAKLNTDLFIIDQHASDEKFNFENLSKTTVLNRQPLLRSLPMDLSAAEEVIVTTHIEVFRKNGFDFTENKNGLPGHRLCLTAVPFSKNITFGIHDVQELVSLLADEPTFNSSSYGDTKTQLECCNVKESLLSYKRNFIRPSRVRAMLASRACRSSIMIGDALSRKEMQKVVCHLADLDSPWNCPHGRPTMRHLVDLANIKQQHR